MDREFGEENTPRCDCCGAFIYSGSLCGVCRPILESAGDWVLVTHEDLINPEDLRDGGDNQ